MPIMRFTDAAQVSSKQSLGRTYLRLRAPEVYSDEPIIAPVANQTKTVFIRTERQQAMFVQ